MTVTERGDRAVRGNGTANKHLRIPAAAVPAWDKLGRAMLTYRPPCSDVPDLWWSNRDDDIAAAIAACGDCRVLCAAYAAAAGERAGVWAGVDRTVRRRVGAP